ncbi:hypothetical protein CEK62_14645 [Alcanivorax sp. N3-2A]|nr:hypothetical protein CEK62_14645 [Alcanivorax sp. N3-2A]
MERPRVPRIVVRRAAKSQPRASSAGGETAILPALGPVPVGGCSMRVVCLLTLALLAGCGQKGPLYFAPKEPAKAAPPTQQATPAADREDDNDDSDQD